MAELTWDGKYDLDGRRAPSARVAACPRTVELVDGQDEPGGRGGTWRNRLIRGDSSDVLPALVDELAGRVDLIYVDPPFNTDASFSYQVRVGGDPSRTVEQRAYRDARDGGLDGYLDWFYETVVFLRDLLADTGSLYVHLDWRAGFHARCILDEVFGRERFRNALIWSYGASGRGAKAVARQFPRNHDLILWYSKSDAWTYHPPTIARRVPLAKASRAGFRRDPDGRWFKTAPRGDYTDRSIALLEQQGRVHRTRSGAVRIKYFLREDEADVIEDAPLGDVWTDIPDAMHLPPGERTGYETQKPEALLERIVRTSSDEGDLVLDCFVGSGTTAAVAERLGRRWITADAGRPAVQTTRKRLLAIPNVRPFVLQDVGAPDEGHAGGSVELSVDVVRQGRDVTLTLTDFAVPLDGVPPKIRQAITHWSQWIDSWAVDWDHRSETFRNRWYAFRTPARPELPLAARHTYSEAGASTVAVKVVDILGGEITRVLPLDVT